MTNRDRLIAAITAQNASPGDAVVSLEDFFTGNNDPGPSVCNLGDEQPTPSRSFSETLLFTIRNRPDVQNVLVRICEYDDPTSWPFTDTVYILTSAPLEDVQRWVSPLKPDEVCGEWMYGPPPKAPEPESGMTPYSIWWD